jgi:hypothetical protein
MLPYPNLFTHRMQRSAFQFVSRIANNREAVAVVKSHVTTFATFRINPTWKSTHASQRLNLTDELSAFLFGQYRIFLSDTQIASRILNTSS